MPVLFSRRPWPRARLLLVATLLAPLAAVPVAAQTVDIFSIRNIQEEVKDDNPTQARNRALLQGQRDAYLLLLQRLTAAADWPRLPKLDDATLEDLVQDVGIDQERMSAVRLLVTLSVRFKPDGIRRLLRANGIAYAEWRGRPLLLLPLWQAETGVISTESANPWRDLWRQGLVQGLVPVMVPVAPAMGDGADLLSGPRLAAAGDDQLADLGQRFNSPDILVVLAQAGKNEQGQVRLDLTLTGTGPLASAMNGQRGYGGEPGETLDQLLNRAALDLAHSLDEGWKSANLLQYDKQGILAVEAPLSGLDDWLSLRDKLARSTAVRAYQLTALSTGLAALQLHYVGEQGQLESVLMQNGLVLTWEDDHWTMRSTGGRGR